MDRAAWGIDDGFWDASGQWRQVPEESLDAISRAMDATEDGPPTPPPTWFVPAGHVEFLQGPADLILEDGSTLSGVDALPRDLSPGYHQLVPHDGGPTTLLVVTPRRCSLPPDLHTWGWAVQLYAARSKGSWGIGDLADLRTIEEWAAGLGAGVLSLNPLHAAGPALPQQPSPYYPSSRCFLNPIFLRVEEVDGAEAEAAKVVQRLADEARALNAERRVDRDRAWALKREALEACFASAGDDGGLDDYLAERGPSAHRFATYCAIADEHGNGWPGWPEDLRQPEAPAVEKFAAEHAEAVRFHAWLQWQTEKQLARTTGLPVVHDLAVGFDPGGADAWAWQDVLALDMRVGAPPDEFNTQGQDWGLPPFVPWKLRQVRYEPFIETLRAAFRYAGGLRVDHVMGLFRLYWLPEGGSARDGGYVRYPASDLLDILALESHRARAFVVGEDLGTVEDTVRAELHDRGILSYRLLWFEPGPPETFPEQALAAVTTHDLPTVAGMWTKSDLENQRSAGLDPNEEGEAEVRRRLQHASGVDDGAPVEEVVVAAHRALGRAPSRVLMATLEDAAGASERPNMPGTVDEWPNWSIALPKPLEELFEDPRVSEIARALGERR